MNPSPRAELESTPQPRTAHSPHGRGEIGSADKAAWPIQRRSGTSTVLGLMTIAIVFAGLGFATWHSLYDLGWAGGGPSAMAITPLHGGSGGEPVAAASHEHPLAPALAFARQVSDHMAATVHDYTATVIKQERFGNVLKPKEVCFVKARIEPFSVYMDFLAPPALKGQEALYVAGANEGNLIGHAGSGAMALLGSKWLPPTGPIAMLGQRYPITELGIANLAKRLIEVGEKDIHYGECYVWRNDNAKVGDRPCISITVMHPVKRAGFLFYIARIFVDKELMVPVHYEAYDWPANPGEPPPLLEQYTYTNLKLNPGLTDADFDPHNPEYKFFSK